MRRTAAVRINLEGGGELPRFSGHRHRHRHRWELAHRVGRVCVAALANSPTEDGRPSGRLSARQAVCGMPLRIIDLTP